MKNVVKVGAGFVITALFLYLSFRNIEVSRLVAGMAGFGWFYLLPVLFALFVSFWVRAVRWRYIIQGATEIRTYQAFEILIIGFMVNNVLPVRIGEFARAYLLGKRKNVSKSLALATVALERLCDGYALILFLAAGLLFVGNVEKWLIRLAFTAAGFYTAIFTLMLLLNRFTERFADVAARGTGFLGKAASNRLREALLSFSQGLDLLKSKSRLAMVGLLSLAVWLIFALSVFGMIKGARLPLPFVSTLTFLGIIALGIMIPSSPGYLGTIQYFSIVALGLWGIDKTTALGFSIIYHIITYVPITGLGLWYLAKGNLSVSRLSHDAS
ncbi:MAG: flippase-like domain-containing protein [Deltaproteobacteria bacterium]|nr:flippase-like domain-containing protein [Deltaproteobacteria bacterium]MBW2122533.1 flippase-like domain-containing protein [Deltaproteobacteria bacterium]